MYSDGMKELMLSTGRKVVVDYDDEISYGESPRNWVPVTKLIGVPNRDITLDETYDDWFDLREARDQAIEAGDHVFNLYKLSHGNIFLSIEPFADPWDSGQIGYCIVRNAVTDSKERAAMLAKSELDTFNRWLNGEIFKVYVAHPDGFNTVIDDLIGGCFIDNEDDLRDILDGLDLTEGELKEALYNIDDLMP